MDTNWLMAALQSPEGMNFLNSWRQRYGGGAASVGGPANTYGSGSPPVSRWRPPNVGAGAPATTGLAVGGGSFSAAGPQTQIAPSPSVGLLRSSFASGASNDLAGQQPSAASPMMPFWNPGN